MVEKRVVFDFTDKQVMKLLSVYRPSRTSSTNSLLKKYKELRKEVIDKHIIIKDNRKITIRFKTLKEEYDCIYYIKELEEVEKNIKLKGEISLRGCYINKFDSKGIIGCALKKVDACFSFWDVDISFIELIFSADETKFHFADFGEGNLNFEMVRFTGREIGFHYANFGKCRVFFQQVQYNNTYISFYNSICDSFMLDSSTITSNINLNFIAINQLCIRHCIIERTLKISGIRDTFCLPKTWNIGRIVFYDKSKKKNDIIITMENFMKKGFEGDFMGLSTQLKLSQFALIKENYHALGEYDGEDLAYRTYMKYKTNTWYGWPLKFFNLVGGYGTKPLRIIISMLVTMFGFAGAYFTFFMDQFKQVLSTFWDVLYYSGITFLTIGYGDISPAFEKSMGLRFVSVAEGFIGLFLMSYLTVAVVRKLLR